MTGLSRRSAWLDAGLLAAAVILLFGATIAIDPPSGVTVSNSPFTDEAWNVVNARNLVLLGHWSTDDWNLYLVNFPFSLLEAIVFRLVGVGIVQARIVPILATAASIAGVSLILRSAAGRVPAILGALALGTSALVLYYGRLAYLEPVVALFLIAGVATALGAVMADEHRRGAAAPRRALVLGVAGGILLGLAVWTKPSAAFAVGGIVAGVVAARPRSRAAWLWAASIAATLVVGFGAWLVLVWRPDPAAISADLRIWASEPVPGSISELIRRATAYPGRSDGTFTLAAPILVAGIAGAVAAIARWRSTPPDRRLLLGVALGWAVFGLGALFVVSYRPNRYVVPMLPAFAILFALGLASVGDAIRSRTSIGGSMPRPRVAGAIAILLVVVCLPGPALDARWLTSTPSSMPGVQDQVEAAVEPGAAVEGDLAPLFAMRVPGIVLVSRPKDNINGGDLYATRGVRWVVLDANVRPDWASAHIAAWSARTTVFCVPWGSGRPCLVHVP